MVEGLTGIKTIQALVVNHEQKQFEHVSNQVRNLLVKLRLLSAMVEPFMKANCCCARVRNVHRSENQITYQS